jgi:rhomboid protease GluP
MDNLLQKDTAEAILTTADPHLSWTWSYVLTATQIPHDIRYAGHLFQLFVPMEFKTRALDEIEGYLTEIAEVPTIRPGASDETGPVFQPPTLLLIGCLLLFYTVTGPWDKDLVWFQRGAVDSEAILVHHEWYRLVTALTLHADIVHLLNNCILGGFLLHFLFLLTGTGLGLFSVLVAGAAGNYINALIHGPGHISVGFSTAVFAVIGILSTLSCSRSNTGRVVGLRVLVPLMGSAALLAMLGSAGERTDMGAHLFGLLAGLLTGGILSLQHMQRIRHSSLFQIFLFCLSLILLGGSWMLACHDKGVVLSQ